VSFSSGAVTGIKAPHFVFYVKEYLEEKYWADVISKWGLKIYTTLDYELQLKAEEIVEKQKYC
jgi:membrane peptidoglycan carboxypeptidase